MWASAIARAVPAGKCRFVWDQLGVLMRRPRTGAGLSIATSSWPGQHSDSEEGEEGGGGGGGGMSWRTGGRQSELLPWSPVRLLQRLSTLLASSTSTAVVAHG